MAKSMNSSKLEFAGVAVVKFSRFGVAAAKFARSGVAVVETRLIKWFCVVPDVLILRRSSVKHSAGQ
jgi:hypothetical protein